MSGTIYQVTDLTSRRTEFIDEARHGLARLRDKDGTSLVMLPESRLAFLEGVQGHLSLFLVVDHCARLQRHLDVITLGQHAWIRSLPVDDFQEFAGELGDALAAAGSDGSTALLDELVSDWRTTARQLDDPLRRRVLLQSGVDMDDYEEVSEPVFSGDGGTGSS